MGLELPTAALITAGIGSTASGIGAIQGARGQRRMADRMFRMAEEPGFLEQLLQQQFNVGQDGTMQMLRNMPGADVLGDFMDTGMPFDTSPMFEALQPIRERQLTEGLGQLRAGAPGIGQRFGSAMMDTERRALLEHLQNITAQDTAMQFQAHEAAQGRRGQAAALGMGTATNLMQLLGQLEQGRRGMFAGAAAAQPPGGVPWGQPVTDIGQLLLLQQLIGGDGGPDMSWFFQRPLGGLGVSP